MMEGTFKIVGPKAADSKQRSVGTGFLMGRPVPGQSNRFFYVLVTAAHVLEEISGEQATLIVRARTASDGYRRLDIASQPIPQEYLATDDDFAKYEFHAGDEVFTVGYPNGVEANSLGFAILRRGRIASHPLAPIASVRRFLVDFSVFGGNSGGPVYINQDGRSFGGSYNMMKVFRVLGLVANQITMTATGERLSVAGVVHATFIKETMALLPLPKAP